MDFPTLQAAKDYTDEKVQSGGGGGSTPGPPGPQGPPGETPFIGDNGNWWIGETDTGVSASGQPGEPGIPGAPGQPGAPGATFTPAVSEDGELRWTNDGGLQNPSPANIKGPPGEDGNPGAPGSPGETPFIGENGHWWIGSTDTGVSASGTQGEPGATFTPTVSADGELTWSNNGGLPNPEPVNIKGPPGSPGGGADLTAGDGITIDGDAISVSLPTKPITLAEYNALSEEEKQSETVYIITDDNSSGGGGVTLQGLEIKTPPEKTTYFVGETFDQAGMAVSAVYDGNLYKEVTDYTITPNGPLEAGVDKVIISYTEGGITVTAEQLITVTSTHIYGVTWDGTSTTKWTRTDDSAMFADPVPYVAGATAYSSPFDNLMPWSGMAKSERTGGTMVTIPKFWYKLDQNTPGTPSSGMTIKIADGPADGFAPSPAHMDRGDGKGERDVVYVGRYHCASDYKSKTGVLPIDNIIRATARTEIHKLGDNIWQNDFAMRFTIFLLYLVEFADWNSQKTIGMGCGDARGIENMGYTDNMPYHTGTMKGNRDTYGVGTQYRNIEGLWENALDWCDGCYYNSIGMHIILNPNKFSDTTGGEWVGQPSDGFPSAFRVTTGGRFDMFIPSNSNGADNTTYSSDYWYTNNYACISAGGRYYQDDEQGLFCFYDRSESETLPGIGARLQELP